jgi:hypothetical protein
MKEVMNNVSSNICDEEVKFISKSMVSVISSLINIIFYICSTNCDITDKTPSVRNHPFHLRYKNKKNGPFQLLPPMQSKIYSVGENLSKQVIEFDRRNKANSNPIRPHVRRAHWHGFWTGPRDGEREFILKWIPPTIVGANNGYIDTVMLGT